MMTSYNLSMLIRIESYRTLFVVQNAFPIELFLLARLIHFEELPFVRYILIFDFIGINTGEFDLEILSIEKAHGYICFPQRYLDLCAFSVGILRNSCERVLKSAAPRRPA